MQWGSGVIPFEMAVFERTESDVRIAVYGMSSGRDLKLELNDSPTRSTISVTATAAGGCVRPYVLYKTVRVSADHALVVQGNSHAEHVAEPDLVDGLPLVCGPDPWLAGLTTDFLHRRGEHFVLMSPTCQAGSIGREADKVA